jgi:hypothetical protein
MEKLLAPDFVDQSSMLPDQDPGREGYLQSGAKEHSVFFNIRHIEAELAELERTQQKAEELKEERNAALISLTAYIPETLDNFTGEEINTVCAASSGSGSFPPTRATTPPVFFVLSDLHLRVEEVCEG